MAVHTPTDCHHQATSMSPDNHSNDEILTMSYSDPPPSYAAQDHHHPAEVPSSSFLRHLGRRRNFSCLEKAGDPCAQLEGNTSPEYISIRRGLTLVLGVLAILGVIHVSEMACDVTELLCSGRVQILNEISGRVDQVEKGLDYWSTDSPDGLRPTECHSHDDYQHRVPLYSAIRAGCLSFKVDVSLYGDELYVGHRIGTVMRTRSFKSLYIEPFVEALSKRYSSPDFNPGGSSSGNEILDRASPKPFTLLVGLDSSNPALWSHLSVALQPLRSRGYLRHWNGTHLVAGPIIIVATGNARFDHVISSTSNPYHDIFFDAPLETMWEDEELIDSQQTSQSSLQKSDEIVLDGQTSVEDDKPLGIYPWKEDQNMYRPRQLRSYHKDYVKAIMDTRQLRTRDSQIPVADARASIQYAYNQSNSYYASTSFGKSIGQMSGYDLSAHQLALLRGQIRSAHRRGLKVRYWDFPAWPPELRKSVWKTLVAEGVDVLTGDDMRTMSRLNSNRSKSRRLRISG